MESECIEKLGSQSSIICSVHSSFQRCNIKSTPKFVSHSTTESSQSSAPTTSSHIATVAFSNTSANVVYRLGNITHSGIRGRFASRIKDQNDSYITITVTVVLLVVVIIVTGIYLTWFCKLRSPTYSRVDSGKSQSKILHVVHCQRPNKYIKEN